LGCFDNFMLLFVLDQQRLQEQMTNPIADP